MKLFGATGLLMYLVLYGAIVSVAILLWQRPVLLSAVFLAVGLLLLASLRDRASWMMYFVAAVCGPAAEFFAVRAGIWSYTGTRWTLPVWLPLAWGVSAVIFLQVTRLLSERGAERPGPSGRSDGAKS